MKYLNKITLLNGDEYDFLKNKKELYLTILENDEKNRIFLREISKVDDNIKNMAWLPPNLGEWVNQNVIFFLFNNNLLASMDIFKQLFPEKANKKITLDDMNEIELQIFGLIFALLNLKEENVVILDNIDKKFDDKTLKNLFFDILKIIHKKINKEYQYFILTNSEYLLNLKEW